MSITKAKEYRFLSGAMTLVLLAVLCVPAFASSSSQYEQKIGFWDWLTGKNSILPDFVGYMTGAICSQSEDGYHHANSYQRNYEDGYYQCICTYCGKHFLAYESDLKQSYDNQVADLPATGYNSDGGLLISTEIISHEIFYGSNVIRCNEHSLSSESSDSGNGAAVRFLCASNKVIALLQSGSSFFNSSGVRFWGKLVAPYDGFYQRIESPSYSAHLTFVDGTSSDKQADYSAVSSPVYYSAGSTIFSGILLYSDSGSELFSYEIVGYPAYYKFTPAPSVDINFDTVYNITTRPTSITGGNYGIIGDNGQITTVTNNNQIVNETNNTYYNPATGETSTITDWSYDYSDRSYNLTLEGGDTSTVTYGDENITITETTINESGDTIINNYTIYYIIDGTGAGTGPENPPAVCTHNWQETRAVPATCTVPGSCLLTCSLCNQTKTETIPALGHNWQVKQTVTTQYDDTGQLIQQGYTIFECSICHEQYKSQDGTIPPGSSGNNSGDEGEEKEGFLSWLLRKAGELLGAVGNGIISFLQSILDGIFDGLISLVNSVFEKLAQLVDLFGSFGDALGVLWTWLPPEIMVVLVAGVSVFVLIALLKLFMK